VPSSCQQLSWFRNRECHVQAHIKNSYQDGLGRMTQTLDHVVVVHILI
jgi:hypothetical protein